MFDTSPYKRGIIFDFIFDERLIQNYFQNFCQTKPLFPFFCNYLIFVLFCDCFQLSLKGNPVEFTSKYRLEVISRMSPFARIEPVSLSPISVVFYKCPFKLSSVMA